jgi:predicted N-acetyltransferase YhbS
MGIELRVATAGDLSSMRPLLDSALEGQSAVLQGQADELVNRVRARVTEADQAIAAGLRPQYRLVIAFRSGVPVGFASMTVVDNGVLWAARAIMIDALHVQGAARKSGVGSALLRASVEFADLIGADEVTVMVSNSRDENRYFARQGFGPMTSRRVGSVKALRRKWGMDPKPDPASVSLTEAQRQRRRRLLLKPRGVR